MTNANAVAAMVTWVGALCRGGLLMGRAEEEGAELALRLLGEEALVGLREWFAAQPAAITLRERRGAIHACIWIAHADRDVAEEEVAMLQSIVAASDLAPDAQDELLAAIDAPLDAEAIARELTQPGLRELVLALAMALAQSDHRLDPEEQSALDALAGAFGISADRAATLRARVADV
ncbi:MAG: DUF533 domain-containing protein [Sandaracinaceae bacterium]|nr:DUF533 domain-containing protein [Sandaracinaceae bacterium]